MIRLCTFASGSSGNCTLIESDTTKILVDCGISGKAICEELKMSDIEPDSIDAIFVTHEHIDHIKSVGVLSRRFNIPVYANEKTWIAMMPVVKIANDKLYNEFVNNTSLQIKDITVTPFETPHDAVSSVGYTFSYKNKKVSVATDIGYVTQHIFENIKGSDIILLESNHDVEMLKKNPNYPETLKNRILGKFGHLSNSDCARFTVPLLENGTKEILLGHLSNENNTPKIAFSEAKVYLEREGAKIGKDIILNVALRNGMSVTQAV